MNATIRPDQIDETPEAEGDLAAVSEVEAGIREFVRNDIAYLRRPAVAAETAPLDANAADLPHLEIPRTQLAALLTKAVGIKKEQAASRATKQTASQELQATIVEGQRVQREISGYAQLSQAAMKSTRMIADNVTQWKRAADGLRNS